MIRQNVNSNNIRSLGYDNSKGTLEIEFLSGDIYEYYNVPYNLYLDFMNSENKDVFFSQYIVMSNYKYTLRKKRNINAQTLASLAGGAFIGSLIAPGVGAFIGGLIGAALSIASSKEVKDDK